MFFKEIDRMARGDRATANPHAKTEPRKIRRAKARQTRSEARSVGAAANQNIRSSKRGNSI